MKARRFFTKSEWGLLVLTAIFLSLLTAAARSESRRGAWDYRIISRSSQADVTPEEAPPEVEEAISQTVQAYASLSRDKVGALMVFERKVPLDDILKTGTALDSTVAAELLKNLFWNKAPLHDGAMVIYGDKIQAAGCFLPLTQKDFPKDYGTRHRAGIGVTEVADVSTIIVSEETGIVSVVKRGEISRYVDSESLRRFLKEYYWKEFNSGGKKA